MNKVYIGIDPGMGGSIAIHVCGNVFTSEIRELDDINKALDIAVAYRDYCGYSIVCCKEEVHGCGIAFKGGSKVSARTQGVMMRNVGWLEGAMYSKGIEWYKVIPREWQMYIGAYGSGDKGVLKDIARESFKDVKVTNKNQDALLILSYCMDNY